MKRILAPSIVAAALMMAPVAASADTISFTLHDEFSGADQPLGSITATFTDVGANTVRLTMDATGLVDDEFVSGWYFNLDPALNSASLTITPFSGGTASSITNTTNCCKADGDGFYDLLFSFSTSPPNFGPDFTTSVYTLSLAGLTANSFNFLSLDAGGHGPFATAAHIQGVGANAQGSGWIAPDGPDEDPQEPLPEPGTMLLFGTGVAAFVARRRQRTA